MSYREQFYRQRRVQKLLGSRRSRVVWIYQIARAFGLIDEDAPAYLKRRLHRSQLTGRSRSNPYKALYARKARQRERELVRLLAEGDEARAERLDPRWGRGEARYDVW